MGTRISRCAFAAGLTVLVFACPAIADAPDVRDAVVMVVTRGTNLAQGNAEVAAQGTGFFIHSEGYLVTSYHLVAGLGEGVDESSIEYEIHFDRYSNPMKAKMILALPQADLMILYAPIGERRVGVLRPAARDAFKVANTQVYVAGFAGGYDFSLSPGFVTALNGPIEPRVVPSWTTSLAFSEGQSGAPIVLASREVIAAVKGADGDNPANGIVVPISLVPSNFWDNTTAGQRLRDQVSDPKAQTRVLVTRTEIPSGPRQRKLPFQWTRSACNSEVKRVFTFSPEPGWRIDLASAVVETRRFSGTSIKMGRPRPGPEGTVEVEVEIELKGSDVCIDLLGVRQPIGSPASFEGTLVVTEEPVRPLSEEVVIADATAARDLQVPLIGKLNDLNYYIIAANGERTEVKPTAASLKSIDGGKKLDLNALRKQINQAAIAW